MMDDRGQVSLEYLLIFAISLILLVVFTLPLAEMTVENTMDVSDTLDVKSDLVRISQAVKEVYGQGQGSRQTVSITTSKDLKLSVAPGHVSCSLKLKDGSSKVEKVNFISTLEKSSINLDRGENSIVVEWPEGSENMQIYLK